MFETFVTEQRYHSSFRFCSTDYGRLKIGYDSRLVFQLGDGTWGTVCSDGFYSDAARVACKQLGYSSYSYSTD